MSTGMMSGVRVSSSSSYTAAGRGGAGVTSPGTPSHGDVEQEVSMQEETSSVPSDGNNAGTLSRPLPKRASSDLPFFSVASTILSSVYGLSPANTVKPPRAPRSPPPLPYPSLFGSIASRLTRLERRALMQCSQQTAETPPGAWNASQQRLLQGGGEGGREQDFADAQYRRRPPHHQSPAEEGGGSWGGGGGGLGVLLRAPRTASCSGMLSLIQQITCHICEDQSVLTAFIENEVQFIFKRASLVARSLYRRVREHRQGTNRDEAPVTPPSMDLKHTAAHVQPRLYTRTPVVYTHTYARVPRHAEARTYLCPSTSMLDCMRYYIMTAHVLFPPP